MTAQPQPFDLVFFSGTGALALRKPLPTVIERDGPSLREAG